MQTSGVRERLDAGIEWSERAPLDGLNSLGLRATARLLATVENEEGLVGFLRWAKKSAEEFVVLGGGTNVIPGEESLDLVILRLNGEFGRFDLDGQGIAAGPSVPVGRLIQEARKAGLSGLEGGYGIPGSLGGALVGNAGTPDWTIGGQVEWVEAFDRTGARRRLAAAEIGFGYRRSTLAGQVIVRARLALKPDSPTKIEERIKRAQARRERQPKGVRSAGCIFRNPPGDSAGRLIDAAGLKGLRRGGAVVSAEHANFIVNDGDANVKDVSELIDEVRARVLEKFDIQMEMEVHILRSTK